MQVWDPPFQYISLSKTIYYLYVLDLLSGYIKLYFFSISLYISFAYLSITSNISLSFVALSLGCLLRKIKAKKVPNALEQKPEEPEENVDEPELEPENPETPEEDQVVPEENLEDPVVPNITK